MTAQAVQEAQPEPKPEILTFPVLREQTRGVAEGHPWLTEPKPGLSLEEHYAQGLYPIHHERWQKFPGGESLDDLAVRAEQAVKEVVLPHVVELSKTGKANPHIAVASHGLFIAEMVPVLLKLDPTSNETRTTWKGMKNTGWTRVAIEVVREHHEGWPEIRVRVTHFNSHEHLNSLVPLDTGSEERDKVQTFAGDNKQSATVPKTELRAN